MGQNCSLFLTVYTSSGQWFVNLVLSGGGYRSRHKISTYCWTVYMWSQGPL